LQEPVREAWVPGKNIGERFKPKKKDCRKTNGEKKIKLVAFKVQGTGHREKERKGQENRWKKKQVSWLIRGEGGEKCELHSIGQSRKQ